MKLKISHVTEYRYDEPVSYGLQQVRLTPKNRPGQSVIEWNMQLDGAWEEFSFDDQHNNRVSLIKCNPNTELIRITCEGEVDVTDGSGVIGVHGGFAPLWYFKRATTTTHLGPRLISYAAAFKKRVDTDDDVDRLHKLSEEIRNSVLYRTGTTRSETTAEESLELGTGVCQDHAHIFISLARRLGFPARYVSGYLMMNDRINQDATHAWAEAYIDPLGWVGFDISNGMSPDERYVRVATGLDYNDAAPVSGMRFGSGTESLLVDIQVQQ